MINIYAGRDITRIKFDERNRVLDKARVVIEQGKKESLLTPDEEIALKEIAGVLYAAYKKAIEILDNKERGGEDDERGL